MKYLHFTAAELSRILSPAARTNERACATDTTLERATGGNVIILRSYLLLSECVVTRRLA